ncbi:hypothetical protein RND81_02G062300 [Saponaria officinalis]|uniref:Leucine-rich repeat-containing N-terminal plant-type domain-containing protein n=1 Tax=Saponaria officinalis TaxID=3572 RepID=A0AAW1MSC9_SAPOF
MNFGWWRCLFSFSILYFTSTYTHAKPALSSHPLCSDQDRSALLLFKHSFQLDCAASALDPSRYPKTKSWTVESNPDCCFWDGVECNEETGSVIELDLSSSCLYGSFPQNSTLFNLKHLQKLHLAINHFNYSQIPPEFGQMRNLKSLNLTYSAFSGQIPSEILKLSEMTVLDLSISNNDGSSGNDPPGLRLHDPSLDMLIRNLTHLRQLYLNDVDISSTLPTFLTNLTSLQAIGLTNANLYGEVSPSFFRLPHLEIIRLDGNSDLAGFLPQFHLNNSLKVLGLFGTSFSGEVPPSIGNLVRLKMLNLANSRFSGLIPPSIGNLTSLVYLILNDNNFIGDIPLSITNLANLETLALSDLNAMSKQLGLEFRKLHRLTALRLLGIKLDSEMSSFLTNLTGLTFLDLSGTQLNGQFPQWVANLTQLQYLALKQNELEGPIPQWISQFTMLYSLQLGMNNLSGNFDIFSGLQNLVDLDLSGLILTFSGSSRKNSSVLKLELLDLSYCNLGKFPLFLQNQTTLQSLMLIENKIEGVVPQWLINTTIANLLIIGLSGNKLTGFEQPISVIPWTNLEGFYISDNKWQGPLLTPPSSLQIYSASYNMLTGSIPKDICKARSLSTLELSNNSMSGHIPSCIGDQLGESLQLLDLRGNDLSGTIPLKFTKTCTLGMINLSENKLEGDLPRSLSNCTKLQILDVGKNSFDDTFPSWLGSQPQLQVLVLRHNKFCGSIEDPKPGYEFRFLRIIDLSCNLFIGHLPSAYLQNWHKMQVSNENKSGSSNTMSTVFFQAGNGEFMQQNQLDYSITITNKGSETLYTKILTVFRVIDFSSNKFTGEIPNIIGDLKGLQALNLSNNNLIGEIPPSLANITDLESLDFSMNKLSGVLPQGLSQLQSLEVFNVSYNHLTGQIPQGLQFNTFDNSSYEGNSGLCGYPVANNCRNVDATPSALSSATSDNNNEDSVLIDWIIRSLGCLSGLVVGFVIGKVFITDKYHDWFMETFQRQPKKRVRRAPRRRR